MTVRIVFFGASELGWECCKLLFELNQEVVGIFTIPQEFRISWSKVPVRNVRYKSFEDLEKTYDVPLTFVTNRMTDPAYLKSLEELRPDLLLVIGWYYMVPRKMRDIATLGAAGIHASLLPKYRGGAPLVWAMINGEIETGVSLFYFEDGVDSGDIIGQQSFPINFDDDIADLVTKSLDSSRNLIREFIPRMAAGSAPRKSQDHTKATTVPQRSPEDGLIQWRTRSAVEVYNWIRAQTTPYPGAFTFYAGNKITIWRAAISSHKPGTAGEPGSILLNTSAREPLCVRCADGNLISLQEVEFGEQRMTATDFIAALNFGQGDIVGFASD